MHDLGTSLREREPEQTLSLVEPYLDVLGIDGVIEHRGAVGIYIFEVVRRNACSGYLNLGKGFTPMAAQASAIMEAVEMSLVEMPLVSGLLAQPGDAERIVRFRTPTPDGSSHPNPSPQYVLPAENLTSGASCYVLDIDIFFHKAFASGAPQTSLTNGLASGNTEDEAILHSLYELVERDAIYMVQCGHWAAQPISPLSLHDKAIDQFYGSFVSDGNLLQLSLLSSGTSAVVFEASIYLPVSNGDFCRFQGWGCNVDPLIASRRAIAEAIQVWRIDDALKERLIPVGRRRGGLAVAPGVYEAIASSELFTRPLSFWYLHGLSHDACPIPSHLRASVPLDLTPGLLWRRILDELSCSRSASVFCVRLSPDEFPVHVLRCFSPGLQCPNWL